jgi:ribosomal protein S27AE
MATKTCFKCGEEKPLSEYYRHKQMKDGRLNKCKDCTRKDAKENRGKNIDYYRAYDRARGNRQSPEYNKEYRKRFPLKYKAHVVTGNAVRDGKLVKQPCEVCGASDLVAAHHDDYAKPLEVRWLCYPHHAQWHAENGEGKNPF